jgi:hypothetical protein
MRFLVEGSSAIGSARTGQSVRTSSVATATHSAGLMSYGLPK